MGMKTLDKKHQHGAGGVKAPSGAPSPLSVSGLSVAYQKKPVLRDVTFEVNEGELIGVIGPNGAGKSTMMKAALGLIPSISGEVLVYGKPCSEQRRLIGYVPQRESVDWDFPTNALDVVLMGTYGRLGWIRRPGAKEKAEAMECLRKVGMADYADRQISQLSGGQQQRVFLARALVQNAKLYFMDEPFAGVDAATEKAIITLLQELKKNGKTVIVVHHDLATVQQYFDSVLLLNVELKGFGPTSRVFTQDMLQHTYGGRLAFLDHTISAGATEAHGGVSL
jgi:manganese/zinc/iron transport system ATP- binding protein